MNKESYGKLYYENGIELGISGYSNYRWLPDITFPICHDLIINLGIQKQSRILDYGCAKGFLVKAFHLLGYPNVYGVDISSYAINNCDPAVRKQLFLKQEDFPLILNSGFDWLIAKDVFEHIPYSDLPATLTTLSFRVSNLFCAVPLGQDGKYCIPEYEKDTTHIIREPLDWWCKTLEENGFSILNAGYTFGCLKTNWSHYDYGNGFFTAKSKNCLTNYENNNK